MSEQTEKTPEEMYNYVKALVTSNDLEQRALGATFLTEDEVMVANPQYQALCVKAYIEAFYENQWQENMDTTEKILTMNNRLLEKGQGCNAYDFKEK